ncbi:MAG: phosphotransferase [Oceanococcus sp.]
MSEAFSGTMPVREKHEFDVAALENYLLDTVDGFAGPLRVEQFKGGQSNPTYKLITPTQNYVLRRKPPGKLIKSAHAVDREYRVISALAGSEVPVAHTYCLCEDEDVIGTAFYVMDCVEGRIFWDPALPEQTEQERAEIYAEMNRVIAALHQIDPTSIGLGDYGKSGNYFARQITRWSQQYAASAAQRIETMDKLVEWLPNNIPPGDATRIVHGDFRLDNMIFHPTENRVLAVLDWELSTLGHPLADFAYHCMAWRMPSVGAMRGLAGKDLEELNIPSELDYMQMYAKLSEFGIPSPDEWDFYMAYNFFRLAGILHGILGRVKDGTASSKQAEAMGMMAIPCANLAWQTVEKIIARG